MNYCQQCEEKRRQQAAKDRRNSDVALMVAFGLFGAAVLVRRLLAWVAG